MAGYKPVDLHWLDILKKGSGLHAECRFSSERRCGFNRSLLTDLIDLLFVPWSTCTLTNRYQYG